MNSFGPFEVCKANPPSNDVCKYGFGNDRGVAVNQTTGNVYVRNERRIEEFSAEGEFIRSFGGETIISGPGDGTPTDAQQEIDVPPAVTGGTFTLEFGGDIDRGRSPTTRPRRPSSRRSKGCRASAPATSRSAAATAPPRRSSPTFSGALGHNPEPAIAIDSTNLVGGSGSVIVLEEGRRNSRSAGRSTTAGRALGKRRRLRRRRTQGGYLAVAPAGAPNAGNVIAADPGNQRVEEFSANGEFIRAFGFDVVAAGPDNNGTGFEECKFGDACKAGLRRLRPSASSRALSRAESPSTRPVRSTR